jgi:LPXTG-motif cell wall-anchored protein
VGKADNKNPKGQMPNGSDHNNGYECDGNNGIGKTNPAHTGCTPPVVTPPDETCETNPELCPPCEQGEPECPNPPCVPGQPECPNPPCVPGQPECPNPPCVPGQPECPNPPCVAGDDVCPPPPGTNRPPTVLGTEAFRPSGAIAGVQATATTAQPAQGTLPNTGANELAGLLAASGMGLLVVGGAVLAMRRRSNLG